MMDAKLSPNGKAACEYAEEYDWRVHPCNGKVPVLKGWPDAATSDVHQIEKFWTNFPDANPGIATGIGSGIVVIDVDDVDEFDQWRRTNGSLPETVTALTPSGGRHLYFKHPGAATSVPNPTKFIPGCDLRGDGGNIIAPAPDNGYAWAPELGPEDKDLAPFPVSLLKYITVAKVPKGVGEPIPEGERNTTLFRLACAMRRQGASEGAIASALQEVNRAQCRPQLSDDEVATIARSASRYEPDPVPGFHRTDVGNARRFAAQFGPDIRWCGPWDRWLIWDYNRWIEDRLGRVREMAKGTALSIYREAASADERRLKQELFKWAYKSETRSRIDAMLNLAQSEPGIAVVPEDLDTDHWLLAVANATIDLRAGQLRDPERSDLITLHAPVVYDPDAVCPIWDVFLERVLPDPAVRRFVQKAVGYSLTGDVSEQELFFLHGDGANGKTTFINALHDVLGDYARQAPPDLLIKKYGNDHPTALADLRGRRLVTTVEVEEGRRMDEVLMKILTGGDTVTARFMRQDFFSFRPTHKLWLVANHKPIIRGTDHAIWRRIRLIPFTVTIPEDQRDQKLGEKLQVERPGILRWAVEGCLAWQDEGLKPPNAVLMAVDDYRTEMDILGMFIADCCEAKDGVRTPNAELRQAYKQWSEDNGERPMSTKMFSMKLREKGFQPYRIGRERGFEGIVVKSKG